MVEWTREQPDLVPCGQELNKAREILIFTSRLLLLWICEVTPDATIQEFDALKVQAQSYVYEEDDSALGAPRVRRRRRDSLGSSRRLTWGMMFGMGLGFGMSAGMSLVYYVVSAGRRAREERMARFLLSG